jgi:hypothetical protein
MIKLIEMDEKVTLFEQMYSQVGPVILINKFNVKEEQVQEFLEAWQMMLSTLNNNQGSFLHSFIVELVEAACFSTTPFGNQMNVSSQPLTLLKLDSDSIDIRPPL